MKWIQRITNWTGVASTLEEIERTYNIHDWRMAVIDPETVLLVLQVQTKIFDFTVSFQRCLDQIEDKETEPC